jgi:type I restriction enzyme S subunit
MSSVVPEGWSVYALGELGQVVGGGTPPSETLSYWGGSVMWATPAEITKLKSRYISKTLRTITKEGLQNSSAKLHPKGTILLTSRASIGYPAINSVPMATNQGFQSLRPNEKLDVEYGYQLILNNRNGLERLSAGSTFLEISSKEINKYKLPIPPLPEQKKIASILTSVDEVIENTQKQIDKLQDLKKATMNELLTKGIGHTEFKDSELERIPKSWEVVKFDEITKSITCGVAATPDYVEAEEGVPFLSAQNVQKGSVVLKTFKHISPEFHLQLTKNTKPELGDILYSRVGAGYGEAAVVNFNWEFSVYVSLTLIKLKPSCNNHFYQYFLNSRLGKDQAKAGVFAGGGVPNLNVGVVKEFVVLVPPIDEQNEIALTILSIDKSISFQRNKLSQTQSLKKSLMQDLLTGKVRVTVN